VRRFNSFQATEHLDSIWWFIAQQSREAADFVETEILTTCRGLARAAVDRAQRAERDTLAGPLLDPP
jgi:plasmid stabilization system protein ParE